MASYLTQYPQLSTPTYLSAPKTQFPAMQRGGRYRNKSSGGASSRGGRSGSSQRLKGCFADGTWHCNCTPRLPAVNFTVKKEGPNKGRQFYTCQQTEPKRCDFFLWAEDARLREEAAVMGNSRSESRRDQGMQEGWNAGRNVQTQQQGRGLFSTPTSNKRRTVDDDTPTPTPSPSPPAANLSKKRKARDYVVDGKDDQEWAITGEEEDAMARVAATTPLRTQKTGVYATPVTTEKRNSRKLPWLNAEPVTPASTAKKTVADYFGSNATTPSKRAKTVSFEEPSRLETEEPETPAPYSSATAVPASPSPIRHRDALVDPADSASSLASEVLAELTPVTIPPEIVSRLRSILSKHDLRTQGVTKGRDISRLALKAKEAKIAELEARIASLEAEREHDRGIIAKLRCRREMVEVEEEEQEEESQL